MGGVITQLTYNIPPDAAGNNVILVVANTDLLVDGAHVVPSPTKVVLILSHVVVDPSLVALLIRASEGVPEGMWNIQGTATVTDTTKLEVDIYGTAGISATVGPWTASVILGDRC